MASIADLIHFKKYNFYPKNDLTRERQLETTKKPFLNSWWGGGVSKTIAILAVATAFKVLY
jgi:hypothetical protein